jgi:dTDP-4-dehydrorhamnose 3,5-epimerase
MQSVKLTEQNKCQLFVPHGFVVLSDRATFAYKVDNYYTPEHDRGIAFNDEQLDINWGMPYEILQISEKDRHFCADHLPAPHL